MRIDLTVMPLTPLNKCCKITDKTDFNFGQIIATANKNHS